LNGSRAALLAPIERIHAVVSRVKQEGGHAALYCVLSQSTLERDIWRGELPETGLATGVRRNTSRRADKPWAPANRLRHRETMADGLSGTALRHESINRLQSIDSKSRQHSQQQPVASVAARNGQRVFARCAKPTEQPRSKLRHAAVAVSRALQALGKTALGVSSCCDACHASPVSAQLAADNRFFASAKRRYSA